jgi:hypothetical protein
MASPLKEKLFMFMCRFRKTLVLALLILLPVTAFHLGAAPPEPVDEANAFTGDSIVINEMSEMRSSVNNDAGLALLAASTMNEDFEGSWPTSDWQLSDASSSDGGEYLWGRRNCRPHAGSFSGWSVGGGAQGNILDCSADYPNNAQSWAVYGPFDLSGATSASLSFHVWGATAGATDCPWDYLFAGSSSDGLSFSGSRYCGDWTNGDESNGYSVSSLDLSSELGQNQVWFGFLFSSNDSVTNVGFTIDDVVLNTTNSAENTLIYLPSTMNNFTWPTPPPTPEPPTDNVPCLLVLANKISSFGGFEIQAYCVDGSTISVEWRYDSTTGAVNGFDLTIEDDQAAIIYEASVDIVRDQFGRVGSYSAAVTGADFPPFTETITNQYDSFGKVIAADVTKVYTGSSDTYTMDLTPCTLGDSWSGYQVNVWGGALNGDLFVIGDCN